MFRFSWLLLACNEFMIQRSSDAVVPVSPIFRLVSPRRRSTSLPMRSPGLHGTRARSLSSPPRAILHMLTLSHWPVLVFSRFHRFGLPDTLRERMPCALSGAASNCSMLSRMALSLSKSKFVFDRLRLSGPQPGRTAVTPVNQFSRSSVVAPSNRFALFEKSMLTR